MDEDAAHALWREPFVAVCHDQAILRRLAAWFVARGHRVVTCDAEAWGSPAEFHAELARALGFPAHYGHNLDALNDSLGDVAIEALADGLGLVIVIEHFDHFASSWRREAQALLEICAEHGSTEGRPLLTLIHSSDPTVRYHVDGRSALPTIEEAPASG